MPLLTLNQSEVAVSPAELTSIDHLVTFVKSIWLKTAPLPSMAAASKFSLHISSALTKVDANTLPVKIVKTIELAKPDLTLLSFFGKKIATTHSPNIIIIQNHLTLFCLINVKLLLQQNEGFLIADHLVSK